MEILSCPQLGFIWCFSRDPNKQIETGNKGERLPGGAELREGAGCSEQVVLEVMTRDEALPMGHDKDGFVLCGLGPVFVPDC